MTNEEEQDLREKIARDIEALMKPQGIDFLTSVVALLWIQKCASIARGKND
jgi:hypothetical protein